MAHLGPCRVPEPPLQPRRGLKDQDLERITRASEAARAPGTHRIYQYDVERGFDRSRADPAAMCAFMTQRVAEGLAVISLGDPGLGRHRRDFVILAGVLTARDFRGEELTKKDR